jgi:hypothetical protein
MRHSSQRQFILSFVNVISHTLDNSRLNVVISRRDSIHWFNKTIFFSRVVMEYNRGRAITQSPSLIGYVTISTPTSRFLHTLLATLYSLTFAPMIGHGQHSCFLCHMKTGHLARHSSSRSRDDISVPRLDAHDGWSVSFHFIALGIHIQKHPHSYVSTKTTMKPKSYSLPQPSRLP